MMIFRLIIPALLDCLNLFWFRKMLLVVLKALNTTVHHEMLSPLRANIEISHLLYTAMKNNRLKKMA